MSVVIKIENLSKYYRLGVIGGGTLREDLGRWWAMRRGKPDPLLKIGEEDHGNRKDGQVWALRDINLEVIQGEILGIIGQNGAGKSTLLKILSRITAPTAGSAKISGRVASLLEVGTGFHPELTGRENIYLNGTILGMSRKEVSDKLDEIIEFAEVSKFIDTPVKRYSSGMTVRLAFAVAAHLEPEILIIDEVLAVGDASFQRKCLGKMEEVSSEGRTVLFVSHNMAAVNKLCSRCICISNGKIVSSGKTEKVVAAYLADSIQDIADDTSKVRKMLAQHQADDSLNIVLRSFDILSDENKIICSVQTGDCLKIRLGYQTKTRVMKPAFGISITDQYGVELLRLSTSPISGFDIESIEGEGTIELAIPNLGLTGGTYNISVYASRPKIEIIWRLENLGSITVIPTDYYNSGFAIENWAGFTVTQHRWHHIPA